MVKRSVKNVVLLLCFLAGAGSGYSQDVSKLYSTDLYTGVANVNIPITTYQLKNNDLGVSLSYNTKGVPVREFAGVAGTHWSLSTAGSVVRSVKGLPDEWYSGGVELTPEYIKRADMLIRYNNYKGRLIVSKENGSQRADQNVYRDPESDDYFFNVGNVQFSFQVGWDGGIFVSSQERYEVTFLNGDQPYVHPSQVPAMNTVQEFNIRVTDKDNGLTYYFSPAIREIRKVTPYFRNIFPFLHTMNCGIYDVLSIKGEETRIVNTWKLDKVMSTENEQVSYSYKTFIMPLGFSADSSWTQIKDVSSSSVDTFANGSANPYFLRVDTFLLVSGIDFPYGKRITLEYDTLNQRLEFAGRSNNGIYPFYPKLNAVLYQEQDKQLKYLFDYSYFHTPSAANPQTESNTYLNDEPDRYSLKLKGVNILDGTNANPLYTFSYNANKQRRYGKGLDFYGYYNGGTTVLGQKGHSLPDLSNRNSDAASMQYGILNSITTGTGSKATFNYSAQEGLSAISSALIPSGVTWYGSGTIGDGLRVNSIEISDVNDPGYKNTISYTYSGGQYFLPGGIYDISSHFANASGTIQKFYRYENFMNPGYFARGTNHGYSNVTETQRNIDNQVLGSTIYQFTNFKEGASAPRLLVAGGGQSYVGFPFTRKQYVRSWEMGLPVNVKSYDNNGLIQKEEQYAYNFITDTGSAISLKVNESNNVVTHVIDGLSVYNDPDVPCANIRDYKITKDPYRPYKGYALLSQKIARSYVSNTQYLAETSTYSYDSRQNMKSVRQQNSDGNYTEQVSIYNYDIPSGSDVALSKMTTDDMERIVASETWYNGTNAGTRNSSSKLLSASIYKYTTANNTVVNKIVYGTALDQPLDYATYMGSQPNTAQQIINAYTNPTTLPAYLEEMTNVQLFNEKGNPTETYVPQSDAYKSMIWDTTIGKKIADVANARSTEIVYAGFDKDGEQNLYFNPQHRSVYNGNSMSVPSINFGIPVNAPLIGKGVYVLEANAGSSKEVYINTLETNKAYRATFWASANAVPQFGIEGGTQFTLTEIAKKGEYRQYEVLFTPTAANQKIGFHSNSSNIALEELRIHPANAVMENYRYTPLFGTSVTTDALGRMTFYEYDAIGRMVFTRDQLGNILIHTEYGINSDPTN
ncbi:hypothetical protein DBR32_12535 [Taibaiella sp. KBW10]|uniref:hypothetical protein n=1 Tax=Taibaiella sp. KBW10 TaxID=2153357 RepID=UPI000F5AE43B|nr:hypothetical protein [Taibaiella sp. KBW10]RQO30390.1 hypothetical protein DBR32_12535 [Taibaiella sp. KBW10]